MGVWTRLHPAAATIWNAVNVEVVRSPKVISGRYLSGFLRISPEGNDNSRTGRPDSGIWKSRCESIAQFRQRRRRILTEAFSRNAGHVVNIAVARDGCPVPKDPIRQNRSSPKFDLMHRSMDARWRFAASVSESDGVSFWRKSRNPSSTVRGIVFSYRLNLDTFFSVIG